MAQNIKGKNVYVDMVADLFHAGHVEFLKEMKTNVAGPNGKLIVGIHDNDVVVAYKRNPILTLEERVRVVEACRWVDEVIPDVPLRITRDFIDSHGIEVVAHGHSVAEHPQMVGRDGWYQIPEEMGIFLRTDYHHNTPSTTDIINRIKIRNDL